MPGRLSKFDFCRGPHGLCVVSRSKLQPHRDHGRPLQESEPHQVAMQLSRHIHPEVSEAGTIWGSAKGNRAGGQAPSRTEGVRDRGRARDGRSCAHAHQHSSEVFGVESGGLHQRKERHPRGSHFLKRTRNYGGQSLWARGFFVDTVGRNAEVIRKYIQNQEKEDARQDELDFGSDGEGKRK